MKKYRLKKDLPRYKAGTIFSESVRCDEHDDIRLYDTGEISEDGQCFPTDTISEWLEEVEERWRPSGDEAFFYISAWNEVVQTEGDAGIGKVLDVYNVFRTREQAEECAKLCLETRKKYTESLSQE